MHTYAVLPVSKAVYDEIRSKLEKAGYSDQFHDDRIDMHGLAISIEDTTRERISER